jgi:diguanylate cyclase (GGDEF)-like protein
MNNIQQKIAKIRDEYVYQLPERIREIENCWYSILQGGYSHEKLNKMLCLIQNIAGACASFGYNTMSQKTHKLKDMIQELINAEEITKERKVLVEEIIESMKTDTSVSIKRDSTDQGIFYSLSSATFDKDTKGNLIILISEDEEELKNLAFQISHFGYTVKACKGMKNLSCILSEDLYPSAVILDTIIKDKEIVGSEVIKKLKDRCGQPLPVFFISDHDDINTRLKVIRAGGDEFFVRPFNIIDLIERLDVLTSDKTEEPYRVLIVDDEPKLAQYYSVILKEAGMETETVSNPLEVFTPLFEFNPDLILMDMYMPACSGKELAKMIRQMKAFVCIPIVFLSAETDPVQQLSAMSVGGDDFITKPVEPNHLVSSVMIRAQRMRMLRSFMDRDSLTGLLNHSKTKEHLDIYIDRAKRMNTSVAFAMIDLDHFKRVNDTYGHYAGDMVIIGLARLLQQRLRKTDIIGRYGGEEFAVILNSTTPEQARMILDEIRVSFGQIRHRSGEREFSVTFSCGIATYPDYKDATEIIKAADDALYMAKAQGRNRIILKNKER